MNWRSYGTLTVVQVHLSNNDPMKPEDGPALLFDTRFRSPRQLACEQYKLHIAISLAFLQHSYSKSSATLDNTIESILNFI